MASEQFSNKKLHFVQEAQDDYSLYFSLMLFDFHLSRT